MIHDDHIINPTVDILSSQDTFLILGLYQLQDLIQNPEIIIILSL